MLNRRTLKRINERPRKMNRLPLVAIGVGSVALAALLVTLTSSLPLALAALLAGALGALGAYWRERTKRISSLAYDDLDGDLAAGFTAVREACEDLASSEKIWRVPDRPDRAQKSGDDALSPAREHVRVGLLETPGIRANVPIWGIDAGNKQIFFFPEGVLIYRGERYEGVSYKSFKVSFSSVRFFEEEAVPEDAEVVGRSWRYTREDGSPDRRYASNPQIPVVLYGLLRLTSPSGLGVRLQVSNRTAAARFARAFGAGEREKHTRRAAAESEGQERARYFAEEAKAEAAARRILGVADDASMSEIIAAYRRLARAYHPDKVMNLAPEVREFADHKMKEINAAYVQVKRQSKSSARRSSA
jgi:DnaJ domain